MKINVFKSDLSAAVSNVSRAVASKASFPALEGLLIKAYGGELSISGYDLEIGMTTTIDATVQQEGEIIVNAKLFSEIVRKLPEEVVSIETDERMMTYIISGSADYNISGMSSVEYPDFPSFDEMESFEIQGGLLKNMIRQTVYAVSESKAKPIYTGSLFEIKDGIFKIAAVDGFRMAIRQENVDSDINTEFVVPGKIQHEVMKLITDEEENVRLSIGQRHILFRIGSYSVVTRLIEGTFLEYSGILAEEKNTRVVIKTREVINAVERMALLNGDKIQSPVRCNFSGDEINFSCISAIGKAKDTVNAKIEGEDVEIGFNNRYLTDALRNCETDEVVLSLRGGLSPMLITPVKGDSFISFIVPMRLSNG